VRATTAFNKMLAIPGADVTGVQFEPSGIVVVLRRRDRRLRRPCGWSTRPGSAAGAAGGPPRRVRG
jgi:hypothetical protein